MTNKDNAIAEGQDAERLLKVNTVENGKIVEEELRGGK